MRLENFWTWIFARWPFMRRINAIAYSESRHLLREPRTLLVIFVQPVMLLVLYGYAINFELRNVPFAVRDLDRTAESRELLRRLSPGGPDQPFLLWDYLATDQAVEEALARGTVRFVLVIPRGFGRDLVTGRRPGVQALFDASDSNTASIASGYLSAMVADYNNRLAISTWLRRGSPPAGPGPPLAGRKSLQEALDLRWRILYNPDLSSRRFIIPGLIAILLSNIAGTLTATTLTREKEMGSFESLLASPVRAAELVLGKMAPYVVVCVGDVALVLLIGGLIFGVWPRGSLLTLTSFSLLFLFAMLAIGMLISATSATQLLALITAIVVTMLPNFFMTGFAFPRSNMPLLLQWLSEPLPATQYLIALRGVFLKGVGWSVLWPTGLWMGGAGAACVALAIRATRQSLQRGLA